MPVFDLYSRRKAEAEGKKPDVYEFDSVPSELRVQVRRILEDGIGPKNYDTWKFLSQSVAREHGRLTLAGDNDPLKDCTKFLEVEKDVAKWLDIVELGMSMVSYSYEKFYQRRKDYGIRQKPQEAIEELNIRFRRASFGYRYESERIIRIDSEMLHSEVVRPALRLLSDSRFEGAEQEFLAAHAHYRAGEYKDCAADALNALESTLKTICHLLGWDVLQGARASDLVKLVVGKGLLPDYLDKSFDQLIATLQSGLPKVRNEEGGHGQGAIPKATPDYIAAYALNLAAAKIVLLVEAFRASE